MFQYNVTTIVTRGYKMKDIKRIHKQGSATVITVTGFLELGKFFEISKEDSVVTIREVEMKVRPDTKDKNNMV